MSRVGTSYPLAEETATTSAPGPRDLGIALGRRSNNGA
jgi:hypothetical protein